MWKYDGKCDKCCVFSKKIISDCLIDSEHKCRPLDDCVMKFPDKTRSNFMNNKLEWLAWVETRNNQYYFSTSIHTQLSRRAAVLTQVSSWVLPLTLVGESLWVMSNIVRFQIFTCQITNQINFSHPLLSYSVWWLCAVCDEKVVIHYH